MEIKIRLFGNFRGHRPLGSGASFQKMIEQTTTPKDIIEELRLPENMRKVIIVNGLRRKKDYVLQDGDVLNILPPLAGG